MSKTNGVPSFTKMWLHKVFKWSHSCDLDIMEQYFRRYNMEIQGRWLEFCGLRCYVNN